MRTLRLPDELEIRSWWLIRTCSAAARASHGRGDRRPRKLLDGINGVALTTGATWESAHGTVRARPDSSGSPSATGSFPGTDIKLFVYRLDVSPP